MPDPFNLNLDNLFPDPFEDLDRALGARRRKPPAFPAMPDEEFKSAIDTVLEKGGNGLQWVGETLGKMGRASLGVIGGTLDTLQGAENPNWGGGLLNLIPLSDTWGITDPKSQVEGRDILTKLGAPENKPGLFNDVPDFLSDVGGFALEVATDPLSYVSPLAWTKSGKAALTAERSGRNAAMQASKLLPDAVTGIAPRIAAGERSLFSVGLPNWMGGKTWDVGAGSELAAGLVEKTIDPAFDWLSRTSAGKKLTQLFDPRVDGAVSHALQQELQGGGSDLIKDTMARMTEPIFSKHDELNRAGWITDPDFVRVMRDSAEGLPPSISAEAVERLGPDGIQEAVNAGRFTHDKFVGVVKDLNMRGVSLHELEDTVAQYAARYHHADGKSGPMDHILNAFKSAKDFVFRERAEHLKDIIGGSNAINDIASGVMKAPNGLSIWDMPREDAVPWLAEMYKIGLGGQVSKKTAKKSAKGFAKNPLEAGSQITPQVAEQIAVDRANELYTHVHNLDQAAYDVAVGGDKKVFNGDVLQDASLGLAKSAKSMVMAEMLHKAAGKVGKAFPNGDKPADWVWLPQAHEDWGLTINEATRKRAPKGQGGGSILDTSKPYHGAEKRSAMYLNREGMQIDPFALASGSSVPRVRTGDGGMKMVGNAVEGMNRVAIPPDLYRDGMSFSKLWKSPDELKGLGQAYDAIMSVWKTGQTAIFPSFHSRNLLGGLFYHWVSGASDSPLGRVTPFTEARNVLKGGELSPETLARIVDPVTKAPAASTSQLVGEMRARKIIGSAGEVAEMTGPERARTAMQGHIPSQENTAVEMLKGGVGDTLGRGYESFKKRADGVGAAKKAVVAIDEVAGAVGDLGRKMGNQVEDTLRIGHYLAQRAKGMSPDEAAASVRKWYFDFSELTQTEKNVMRRVFPFYTWFRKNTPLVLGELLQKPGGKMAQSIRAINEPRDRDTYIPEWVSQGGAAIPTGKEGRFLTSLGLPFESALNYTVAPTMGKTVQRNAEQAVGAANPLIRGAYTAASGKDPFSGRDINELYPFPTSNPLINAVVANSPASRTSSTTRRFIDERKSLGDNALDFLTGVKVTDVSGGLENAKELEARKALQEIMRSDPSVSKYLNTFSQSYLDPTIPKEQVPQKVGDVLRMQAKMTKNARERAKEKNKKKMTEQQELLTTPR